MGLFRAIYASQPFGFEEGILNQILASARRCNVRNDVTGALICRSDIYLQWLEGPEEQVKNTLQRISRDDRHTEMKVQIADNVSERMFGDWAMLHDPAVSWIWTQDEVADGAVARAAPEKIIGFFLPLRGARVAPEMQ
jgi:hypothetical protein